MLYGNHISIARGVLMKKILSSFIKSPLLNFIACILAVFAFFGISSETFIETFGKYNWIIDATRWSLIIGAFIFAIHAYLRAEKNRKKLINVKTSAFDEAYKNFTKKLSYAFGRYKGYSSNMAPDERKYTVVGVMEQLNEVKATRLQLLSVSGENVRSTLLEAGTDWLEDIDLFGKTAPSIMDELSSIAFKDRS
jgi:hypothetical protein